MNFTPPIERRLKAKGKNKAWLAREAQLSKGGLSDLMNGKESVSFPRLIKIAAALKVSVWRLVKEAEKEAG